MTYYEKNVEVEPQCEMRPFSTFQVAERAPGDILRDGRNYRNQAVLNMTQSIQKMFCEMDEELVLACQRRLEEEN
ncbi:hypothetical protein GQ457_16G003960 [Hibiscus cannabinus]